MTLNKENHQKPTITVARTALRMKSPEAGDFVFIRYKDHVLFKDSEAENYRPWIRETVGWLDYEDDQCIRIIWERFLESSPLGNARLRSTGLVITKADIVELRRVSGES